VVTFKESFGRHTIKAVATDDAGNPAVASIKIKNVRH